MHGARLPATHTVWYRRIFMYVICLLGLVGLVKGDSKWSHFCHLVLYGKCLYVVFKYPLVSKKSGVSDLTIGMTKKIIHFNGESPSFYNMMKIQMFHKKCYQVFQ